MVTSIDGKVTGEFLDRPESQKAIEAYYQIYRVNKYFGFICGRVTMESSFTGGYYPDLTEYEFADIGEDFIPKESMSGFYAVAFDTNGKLGWRSPKIIDPDGDPGYDGTQIVEVLSENVDTRYLGYLKGMKIPYIFAGKDQIDVETALRKLKQKLGTNILWLQGGSIINGSFLRADCIDELSLVIAPATAHHNDKPLFMDGTLKNFELVEAETRDGVPIISYRITRPK